MATKKNAAPSKPATAKTAAPAKRVTKKTPVKAATAVTDVPDPAAKVSTQLTAKRVTRSAKPAVEKAAAKKPVAKKTTAVKTIVSPATTKAIAAGAAAVKSMSATPAVKERRSPIFKSFDSSAIVNSSTKNDPAAKATANKGLTPAVETKPVRRTFKATVTAGLKKKAEDLIAEAKAAGLILTILTEGGKPGIKLYPIPE